MKPPPFEYHAPDSLEEALDLLRDDPNLKKPEHAALSQSVEYAKRVVTGEAS